MSLDRGYLETSVIVNRSPFESELAIVIYCFSTSLGTGNMVLFLLFVVCLFVLILLIRHWENELINFWRKATRDWEPMVHTMHDYRLARLHQRELGRLLKELRRLHQKKKIGKLPPKIFGKPPLKRINFQRFSKPPSNYKNCQQTKVFSHDKIYPPL